jgi:hypothetical protein
LGSGSRAAIILVVVIDLLAVHEDGSSPDVRLPYDVRRALVLIAGTAVTLRVRLVTRSGVPVRIGDSESLVMTARSLGADAHELFQKTATRVSTDAIGIYRIAIADADTGWLGTVRRGVYDLVYRQATGPSSVLPASSLVLSAAATPPAGTPPIPPVP